ncbi:MAG: efflux transporter outer membrane subunit [Alphaproteobacteria bacterium]|nr:efflux transporter outer membrane subunit [Alphaproteobacteria bacterium]
MAPTYKRPDAPIPNNYAAQSADNDKIATLPAPAQFFKDEPMARLIGLALENNRDLRLAMLNIEKTRAQYRIQRADLLPTINATGSLNWQHLPADIAGGGVEKTTRQYTASLGFSAFELDLFGRIRSLKDQALENFYAVQEEARAAKLSLTAEVAAVYLQLVADRQQYDLTQATLENRKKNHDIIYRKFKAGIASDLELSQAESVLNEAQANLAVSAAMIGQDENHLMLLIAAPLPKDLPGVRRLADVKAFEDVSSGAPSLLLARRPDIRAAEHMLKGAGANIGAARANFFPIISLTGNFGTMSLDMRNLFEGPSQSWSFFPQIVLPLFDTGRNIARLEVAKAERAMAVARYEKAIQTGFREVTDALIQRDNMAARLMAQESLVASTTRSMDHATARYEAGIDAYINVLDAQRSLFSAQSTMIAVHLLRETNALTLYKALGGGW